MKKSLFYPTYLIFTSIVVLMALNFSPRKTEEQRQLPKAPAHELLETFSQLALMHGQDIHKKFQVEIEFNLPSSVQKIIYGAPEYGFFETDKFTIKNRKIKFKIIPPGYERRIRFYAVNKQNKWIPIGVKNFNSKIPAVFKKIKIKRKNEFSFPFMIVSALYIPPKQEHLEEQRIAFNLILNRLGEIVYIRVPGNSSKRLSRYGIMKQITPGVYATLFGEKSSYFEIFDTDKDIFNLSPLEQAPKKVIHHDFVFNDNNPDEVFVLGNRYASIRGYTPNTNVFEKLIQLIGNPFTYVTSTIESLNLKTNKFKTLVTFDQFLHPLKNIDLNYKKLIGKSEFEALNMGGVREWTPEKKVQIDHTHANSLKRIKPTKFHNHDGYIISLRNQHKIVFLSTDFKKVLWTVGHESSDTYQLKEEYTKFYRQHDADITKTGHLVLYDNHTSPPAKFNKPSRFLSLAFDEKNKTMNFIKHFVSPLNLYHPTRGSSEVTKNGNRLIFAPNAIILTEIKKKTEDRTPPKDYAYEIDPNSNQILAEMIIEYAFFLGGKKFFNYGAGSRAFPIYSLGNETFLGYHATKN